MAFALCRISSWSCLCVSIQTCNMILSYDYLQVPVWKRGWRRWEWRRLSWVGWWPTCAARLQPEKHLLEGSGFSSQRMQLQPRHLSCTRPLWRTWLMASRIWSIAIGSKRHFACHRSCFAAAWSNPCKQNKFWPRYIMYDDSLLEWYSLILLSPASYVTKYDLYRSAGIDTHVVSFR